MNNSNLSQEELEKKVKEMTNNRIHINMIFDKDSIFSDIEYVDKYFNKEQKKNYLKYIQYEKIH